MTISKGTALGVAVCAIEYQLQGTLTGQHSNGDYIVRLTDGQELRIPVSGLSLGICTGIPIPAPAPIPDPLDEIPVFSVGEIIYNSAEEYPRTAKVTLLLGNEAARSYQIAIVPDGLRALEYGTYGEWKTSSHNGKSPIPPYEFSAPPSVNVSTYKDECVGTTLYRNRYINGVYTDRELLAYNALQCVSEPITTYNEVCENYSVYREKYIDGVYVERELILANAPQCGYVEPEIIDDCAGIICESICIGFDKWQQECIDGNCRPTYILEENCEECGFITPAPQITTYKDVCEDYSVYREKYIDGVFVERELILENAPQCGYDYVSPDEIIPDDPPGPVEPISDKTTSTYIYIIAGVAILFFIILMRK